MKHSTPLPATPWYINSFFSSLLVIAVACGEPDPGPADPVPVDPAPVDPDPDPDPDPGAPIELCDEEPVDWPPRPLWGEVTSGYPDYQNLSSNLNFLNSIKLLTSMFTKLTSTLEEVQKAGTGQEDGYCLCNCDFGNTQLPQSKRLSELGDWIDNNAAAYSDCFEEDITREACATHCEDLPSHFSVETNNPVNTWGSNDLFLSIDSLDGAAELGKRFALELIGTLDGVSDFLQGSAFQDVLDALGSVGATLKDFQNLIQGLLAYVDRFTSGYHLGAYSEQRPDLHMCVGYAGHGVYAQMGNLGGNKASIGARYTSHNVSESHRAQFRSGGFGVSAFGKSLSILPAVEVNIQVDGFSFWNAQEPFGIPAHVTTISTGQIEEFDVFQLVDETELAHISDSNGNIHVPGSLFIANHYPIEYTSALDGQSHIWPRLVVSELWEEPSTAIMSAGLNLKLEIEPLSLSLPTITLFPGATATPYFKLGAGVGWTHDAFIMLERIRDKVNEELPASAQLGDEDFAREMHDLQAPDVSEDNGTTAFVTPELGVDLLFGLDLAKWLKLGIFVNVGIGAKVEPGGWGGVVDMNYALVETMVNSNPPVDEPCNAVFEIVEAQRCSNVALSQSAQTYSCEAGKSDYCSKFGYCTDDEGNITAVDVTLAQCLGNNNGDGDDHQQEGRCCMRHDTNVFQSISCAMTAQTCEEADGHWVPGGVCTEETNATDCSDPNDPAPPANQSNFVAYTCGQYSQPELTGWEGPGCHPLAQGFMSACGCAGESDCAGNETCSEEGICLDNEEYACICDPDDVTSCGTGRTCFNGACLKNCSLESECAAGRVCEAGLCRPPHGIPTAEEVVWGMQNIEAPMHAVSSYAISDLLLWAYLTAGIDIKLTAQIFGKEKEIELFDWSDVWEIASSYKIWYQAGLEARYQSPCAAELGEVTNRQPEPVTSPVQNLPIDFLSGYVDRYPETQLSSVFDGNAGSTEDFLLWCKPDMKNNVEDPDAPQLSDISNSLVDVVEWGEDIGLELWASYQLCVDGQSLDEWAQNVDGSIESLSCIYQDPSTGQQHSWPCMNALMELAELWGCFDTTLSPHAAMLANSFPGTHSGGSFNLSQMLVDPEGELSVDNLLMSIRYHYSSTPIFTNKVGEKWLDDVEACFDLRWDAETICPCSDDTDCKVGLGQTCGPDNLCLDAAGETADCSVFNIAAEPGPCWGACRTKADCYEATHPSECIRDFHFQPGDSCQSQQGGN